jgi:aldehyde:ferredoxin oxidoreductase
MTILRVQMTNGQIATEPFPKEKILGGRATVDFFLSQQGTPSAHPLSEKAIFIVAPGLFAGTGAPQSGRLSVGGKSPLTGGIKEANVGGTASHKLGRLGIRVVVVEGISKEWQVLKIDKEGASLENAGDIIGLPNYNGGSSLLKAGFRRYQLSYPFPPAWCAATTKLKWNPADGLFTKA